MGRRDANVVHSIRNSVTKYRQYVSVLGTNALYLLLLKEEAIAQANTLLDTAVTR